MKKIKVMLLVSAIILSFAACSDKSEESSQMATEIITETSEMPEQETAQKQEIVDEKETPTEVDTDSENGELEVTYTGDTQEIGADGFGFMQVPKDWVSFKELGASGSVPLYQYASPDQISVVTMSYVEDTDAKTFADTYYESMSKNKVEGLTGATVTLDGRDAYQVYAYYTDVNKVLVAWIFDGEDGLTHSLAIESQDYDIISLSGTYTLNK